MSYNAYQAVQNRIESPRETEYRLFAQVTRALIDIKDLPKTEFAKRMDILDWNRRVWSFLAGDCAKPNNALPENLKVSIIQLAHFVDRYSSSIMKDGEDVDTLIEINKSIMQGLAAQAELQAKASGQAQSQLQNASF